MGSRHTSEWFNTAGRSVKTGLIASVIVSQVMNSNSLCYVLFNLKFNFHVSILTMIFVQWTWAATILQSSNVAWEYGVSGPFWYASGATIQA